MKTPLGKPEATLSESDKFLQDKDLRVQGFLKSVESVSFSNHFQTVGRGANRVETKTLAPQPLGYPPNYDVNLCRGSVVLNLRNNSGLSTSEDVSVLLTWGFSLWRRQRVSVEDGKPFLFCQLAQGSYEKVSLEDDFQEALCNLILTRFEDLPESDTLKVNLKSLKELTTATIEAKIAEVKAGATEGKPSKRKKAKGQKLVSADSY